MMPEQTTVQVYKKQTEKNVLDFVVIFIIISKLMCVGG
jgi:hypothetical protein